jgi:hypothetical protein
MIIPAMYFAIASFAFGCGILFAVAVSAWRSHE